MTETTHTPTSAPAPPPPTALPDEEKLMQLLRAAHEAGDESGARRFATMIKERRSQPKYVRGGGAGHEPPAELSWPGALRLGAESMDKTFNDLAVGSRTPEVWVPKAVEAVGGLASSFIDDPSGFTYNMGKGAVDAFEHYIGQNTLGILGSTPPLRALDEYVQSTPVLREADRLLGGDPGANTRRIKQVKQDVSEKPFETGLNMAAITSLWSLPKFGIKAAQNASGKIAAAQIGGAGRKFLLGGDGTTNLDLLAADPKAFDKAMRYMSHVAPDDPGRVAFEEMISKRDKLTGERWRKLVEEAKNMGPDSLIDPSIIRGEAEAGNKAIEDAVAAASTEAKNIDQASLNAKHAKDLKATKAERDRQYRLGYDKGFTLDNMPPELQDVLKTNTVQDMLPDIEKWSQDYTTSRGYAVGDLEKLDRIEQQLTTMAGDANTIDKRLYGELARKIRDGLNKLDNPEWQQAKKLHADVETYPEKPPKSAVDTSMPEDLAASLQSNLDNIDKAVNLSKPSKLNFLMSKVADPDLAKWIDEPGVAGDLLEAGVKRERAFRYLKGKLDAMKASSPFSLKGATRLLGKYGPAVSTVASALLGAHPVVTAGAGLLAGAKQLRHMRQAQIGKHIYRQNLPKGTPEHPSPYHEELPPHVEGELLSKLDWLNISYAEFLAHENHEAQKGEHH